MKRLFLVVACLLWSSLGYASLANYYIGAAQVGSGFTTSCTNHDAYTFFNTGGNWGAGGSQIGSDTVVHICDAITFSASATGLTFQGSGTANHPVTLKFEAGAVLQSPAFTRGIATNSQNFLVIDGNSVGIIQNTDNGAALGHHVDSLMIDFTGSHDVEVKHFDGSGGIHNAYIMTGINALTGATGSGSVMTYTCSGTCQIAAGATVTVQGNSISGYNVLGATVASANSSTFTVSGATTGSGSGGTYSGEDELGVGLWCSPCAAADPVNINLHHNKIDNADSCIQMGWGIGTSSGYTIDSNTTRNCSIDIDFANGSANSNLTGYTISNNDIADEYNWDDQGTNGSNTLFHHNGMHLFVGNTTGSVMAGGKIFGNYMHGNPGFYQTAAPGIFTEDVVGSGSSRCNAMLIYDNVFTSTSANAGAHPPTYAADVYLEHTRSQYICMFNNTFIPPTTAAPDQPNILILAQTDAHDEFLNNIVVSASFGVSEFGAGASPVSSNNNVWFNLPYGFQYQGNGVDTYAQWKAECIACDTASVTTDPKVNASTFLLGSGSSAIGLGQTLSAFFTTDKAGNTRTPPWDAGAYTFATSDILSFNTQPTAVNSGSTIASFVVSVLLPGGGTDTGSSASITLTGDTCTVTAGSPVSATAGTATFGSVVVTGYQACHLTASASGITSAVSNSFNVTDITPPIPGNSGTITTSGVSSSAITVSWTAGTDAVTPQPSLQYEVCRSASTIPDKATCKAATIVLSYATNVVTFTNSGLVPSTTYHYNVLIKDLAGNENLYTDVSQATNAGGVSSGGKAGINAGFK